MTVKERVLASRLIQKIDRDSEYAREIGLSYEYEMVSGKDRQRHGNAEICTWQKLEIEE